MSAASGGNSEPKQGQRSQSARGFCPRSTMRVPQPDIIEHFGNADAVPQPPERCLSRKAGIVRCCLRFMPVRGVGEAAPTTNLLVRYTFLMKNRIRPRRGRVTPPYREFTGLQRDLKRFVGNGLDRSGCFPYFPFVGILSMGFGTVKTVPYRAKIHRKQHMTTGSNPQNRAAA